MLELRGDPTRGAELEAPTAPHATAPVGRPKRLSGPARFWDPVRIRIVFMVAFVISLGVHVYIAPWRFMPNTEGLEFNDPEGELAIPVDLIAGEAPADPAPTPPPVREDPKDPNAPSLRDASAPKKPVDAGSDAETMADAMASIEGDGAVPYAEGGAPTDAGEADGSALDEAGALVAVADAGPPGPNDRVNAGPQNVQLWVNSAAIRAHPVGAKMGPILQHIPQWKDFLKGSQASVDPIRDTEWIFIYGPSLIHTDKDAVLVKYSIADDIVDKAVDGIARQSDKGGPYDAGVKNVPASIGHADAAQRVFLRPQSKLLVIVPPSHAHEAAKAYRSGAPFGPKAGEAMRLKMKDPSKQMRIPKLTMPDAMTELRLWVVPRSADAGADAYLEGDCKDETAANEVANALNGVIQNANSGAVQYLTGRILNNAKVVPNGRKIEMHLDVSKDQLDKLLNLVAAFVGAPPPAP